MTRKRDRQRRLARERYLRQQQRRMEQRHKTRIRAMFAGGACALAAIGVGAYFLFAAGGGGRAAASPSATPTPTASATPTAAATTAEPAHHCTYTKSGTAARAVSLPPSAPDYRASYQATIATNRGDIGISLLNSKATCTVNSFVHLAEQKFFNNTKCHRLTTKGIYVLQCGDPTGTGSGGPGYKFASENLTGAKYPAGTLAMANTGQPDSNGSQFFLVYKNSPLPPNYTPFGTITTGMSLLDNVAKAGSTNSNGSGDGAPKEKVEIKGVTIRQT